MYPSTVFDAIDKSSSFVISSHLLSDIDGVCSAFILNQLYPKSRVVFFDKPSRDARLVCEYYNLEYEISNRIDPTNCVLVDVDDPSLIPRKDAEFLCTIDHHLKKTVLKAKFKFSFPDLPSTTYAIYGMMKHAGIKPSGLQADLILLGLIADTYRFKSVKDQSIFRGVADLLDLSKTRYDDLVLLVEKPPFTESERLVFARSFMNYRILRDKRKKLVFILSDCESFQSIVATRIVQCLAADFGLAYAKYDKENEVRISLRSSPSLQIHLGQFAAELAEVLGGTGGGHMYAAGVNAPISKFSEVEDAAIQLLREKFTLTEYE